jgi:hypothetical protein
VLALTSRGCSTSRKIIDKLTLLWYCGKGTLRFTALLGGISGWHDYCVRYCDTAESRMRLSTCSSPADFDAAQCQPFLAFCWPDSGQPGLPHGVQASIRTLGDLTSVLFFCWFTKVPYCSRGSGPTVSSTEHMWRRLRTRSPFSGNHISTFFMRHIFKMKIT